jgi:hypothetical protein
VRCTCLLLTQSGHARAAAQPIKRETFSGFQATYDF